MYSSMGVPQRRVSFAPSRNVSCDLPCHRLQTPVYTLYAVPTIVSAAILLSTRHLGISLPSSSSNRWWELFDAEWEDVWSVCGYVMRLYRERSAEDQTRVMGMVSKKGVRQWLDENRVP